jgi:hypothetical protein
MGQRIFTVEFHGSGSLTPPVVIDCVSPVDGTPCNGWSPAGVTITDDFGGFPLDCAFTGALLPNAALT